MRFEDDVCEIGERGGGIDEWTNTKRRDRRRRYIRPPNYDRGVGLLKYKGQWDKRTIRVGRPVGGAAIVDSPSKLSVLRAAGRLQTQQARIEVKRGLSCLRVPTKICVGTVQVYVPSSAIKGKLGGWLPPFTTRLRFV